VPALVLLGAPAREPVLPAAAVTVDAARLDARPEVEVPPDAVPPVEVSDEVRSVVGSRVSADAGTMAQHLVEDLLIEADALRSADVDLAATAVAGARLEAVRRQVADGAATPADHTFETMTVVVVRDPEDPQAVPRFGVHATGTRTAGDAAAAPFDEVFVMAEVDEVWLLTDTVAPTG
jgi:hypothetical protein